MYTIPENTPYQKMNSNYDCACSAQEKVRNVQAWFFKVVFNIKPLRDWMSSVGIA